MMCFWGGGVGHASTREASDFFKQDRDSHDAKRVFEDVEDDGQTQNEATVPNQYCHADRDNEEEDYGYNRGQFSDMEDMEDEDEDEDECRENEFGPDNNGGEVDEFMDNFGYGEM